MQLRKGKFGTIQVVQRNGSQALLLNGQTQGSVFLDPPASVVDPSLTGAGPVSTCAYPYGWLLGGIANPFASALMIGLGSGAGAVQFLFNFPDADLTVVEIDPVMAEVALRAFPLLDYYINQGRLNIVLADAKTYCLAAPEKFDVGFADGYDGSTSFALITDYLPALQKCCNDVVLNVIDSAAAKHIAAIIDLFKANGPPIRYAMRATHPGLAHTSLPKANYILTTIDVSWQDADAFLPFASLTGENVDFAKACWSLMIAQPVSVHQQKVAADTSAPGTFAAFLDAQREALNSVGEKTGKMPPVFMTHDWNVTGLPGSKMYQGNSPYPLDAFGQGVVTNERVTPADVARLYNPSNNDIRSNTSRSPEPLVFEFEGKHFVSQNVRAQRGDARTPYLTFFYQFDTPQEAKIAHQAIVGKFGNGIPQVVDAEADDLHRRGFANHDILAYEKTIPDAVRTASKQFVHDTYKERSAHPNAPDYVRTAYARMVADRAPKPTPKPVVATDPVVPKPAPVVKTTVPTKPAAPPRSIGRSVATGAAVIAGTAALGGGAAYLSNRSEATPQPTPVAPPIAETKPDDHMPLKVGLGVAGAGALALWLANRKKKKNEEDS